ncbi:hypothetical protein LINGRAHAP2_LOCUS29666 [Linum grandiflorum]
MLSILAQERVLGFALGGALTGFVVFEQRRRIRQSVSAYQPPSDAHNQSFAPLVVDLLVAKFDPQYRILWLALSWKYLVAIAATAIISTEGVV